MFCDKNCYYVTCVTRNVVVLLLYRYWKVIVHCKGNDARDDSLKDTCFTFCPGARLEGTRGKPGRGVKGLKRQFLSRMEGAA